MIPDHTGADKDAYLHMDNLLLLPSGPLPSISPVITWVELEGMYCMVEEVRSEGLSALRVQIELLLVLKPTCCGMF